MKRKTVFGVNCNFLIHLRPKLGNKIPKKLITKLSNDTFNYFIVEEVQNSHTCMVSILCALYLGLCLLCTI